MSAQNHALNRRELLAAATAALTLGRTATATTNPFPSLFGGIVNASKELYQKAAIYDPSNVPVYKQPGLPVGQLAAMQGAFQELDAWMSTNGIYQQGNVFGGGSSLLSVNPSWLKFAANQAQAGLPNDFFNCISFAEIAQNAGIGLVNGVYSGGDLQNTVASIIAGLAVYASGDFTSGVRRRKMPSLVNAMFQHGGAPLDAAIMAGGATVTGAGIGLVNLGGGPGVLGGGVSTGAAGAAFAWTGVGVIILGIGVMVFGAYRVFTQKQGYSPGPWDKGNADTDPVYLKRIHGTVNPLYPPLLPPPAPPLIY